MKKKQDEINAFLGKDTEFEGKLSFTGAVRIDGRLKGEIVTEGTLIVGETAVLESDIQTSNIVISGEIHGNIIAENMIEIRAPGKIFGDLKAPIITIAEGVTFEGNCQMQKKDEEDVKKAAVLHNDNASENKI